MPCGAVKKYYQEETPVVEPHKENRQVEESGTPAHAVQQEESGSVPYDRMGQPKG